MKLATTTADFSAYGKTPAAALELCAKSPFRYIDLNLPHRYMGEDWERITHEAGETAARLGMTLIQAHGGDFLSAPAICQTGYLYRRTPWRVCIRDLLYRTPRQCPGAASAQCVV